MTLSGSRLNEVFKKIFVLVDKGVIEAVLIHALDQRVKIVSRLYFNADQCGPGFFVVFLDKFKSNNVIGRTQDVIDKFFQRARTLRETYDKVMRSEERRVGEESRCGE